MGGHHDDDYTPPRQATRKEMAEARLPIAWRDQCASLLIPLNECRRETFFMPFKCQDLRHAYEKCQYMEWLKRVDMRNEQKNSSQQE